MNSLVVMDLQAMGWDPSAHLLRHVALAHLISEQKAKAHLLHSSSGQGFAKAATQRLQSEPPVLSEFMLAFQETAPLLPFNFLIVGYSPFFTAMIYQDLLYQSGVVNFQQVRFLGIGGATLYPNTADLQRMEQRICDVTHSKPRIIASLLGADGMLSSPIFQECSTPHLLHPRTTLGPATSPYIPLDHALDFLVDLSEWAVWSVQNSQRIRIQNRLRNWPAR